MVDKKTSIILNVTAIILLSILCLGVYLMPRYNYTALTNQLAKLEFRQAVLENRMAHLNIFADDNKKREAVLTTLQVLPGMIADLRAAFTNVSSDLASNLVDWSDLENRVRGLEERIILLGQAHALDGGDPPAANSPHDATAISRDDFTEPVKLSEKLREKAEFFSPRGSAEWSFEQFLIEISEVGFLPVKKDEVGPETYRQLLNLFTLFKSNIDLINFDEKFLVNELVEESTEKGDYIEFPADAPAEAIKGVMVIESGVLTIRDVAELGMKRYYRFKVADHPEFSNFNDLRKNARDHLVSYTNAVLEAAGTPPR